MELDLNRLKEAARLGRVDKSVRRKIFAKLSARTGPLYELLDLAGWSAAYDGPADEEVTVVESFLDYRQDTMVPGLALTILCVRWGLEERYSDRIKQFLDASNDSQGTMHLAGANAAAKLLAHGIDRNILASLLRIVRDPEELSGTRDAAYSALASARGIPLIQQINKRIERSADADEIVRWAESVVNR